MKTISEISKSVMTISAMMKYRTTIFGTSKATTMSRITISVILTCVVTKPRLIDIRYNI